MTVKVLNNNIRAFAIVLGRSIRWYNEDNEGESHRFGNSGNIEYEVTSNTIKLTIADNHDCIKLRGDIEQVVQCYRDNGYTVTTNYV